MTMKKVLLAGAATLAISMGAAVAHAQDVSTGYVGVNYSDLDGATLIDVQGTVSFDVSENWELQADGQIGSLNPDGAGSSETIWGPTGHLFWDKDNLKAGVFVGYQDLGDTFGTGTTIFGYGLEGRWAASDAVSIGALAGWGNINVDGAPDMDLTAYKADISFFSSDNLRWDASVTRTTVDWGPFSGDSTILGVGAEWQLADKPVSFTFGYSSASTDLTGASNATTWSVGVRRTFGGSLKDRDRTSSPFLGLPFAFGGIQGVLGGLGSTLQDVINCFDDEVSCPNDAAINAWEDGFDDSFNEQDLFCLLGGCND